jgi:hypothetical protein
VPTKQLQFLSQLVLGFEAFFAPDCLSHMPEPSQLYLSVYEILSSGHTHATNSEFEWLHLSTLEHYILSNNPANKLGLFSQIS